MSTSEDMKEQQQNFYYSPMGMYSSSIVQLTNPDPEVTKMELTFRGYKVNDDGTITQAGHRLLNERGILAVVGMVQSVVNQVTIFSTLEKEQVFNIMKNFQYTLSKDLMMNRKHYEIGYIEEVIEIEHIKEVEGNFVKVKEQKLYKYIDKAARDKISSIARTTGFICIRRAFQGDDKKFWKMIHHENSVQVDNRGDGGSPKGLASIFNLWKK